MKSSFQRHSIAFSFLHEAISKVEFNVKNFENVSSSFLDIFLKFRSLKD